VAEAEFTNDETKPRKNKTRKYTTRFIFERSNMQLLKHLRRSAEAVTR